MEGNGMSRMKYLFLSISPKPQIFIPPKLDGIGENEIRFNKIFTKNSQNTLYNQLFILK